MNTTPLQTEWEPCLLEPARDSELEAFSRREAGAVMPIGRHLASCPWAVRALICLAPWHGTLLHLDHEVAELVELVVSQENSCRYCYAVSRLLLKIKGMSEARVQELERRLQATQFDAHTAAALGFARKMTRANPRPLESDWQAGLAAGLSVDELHEVAFVALYTMFANRLATLVAVPPGNAETMPDRWLFRLIRPLAARLWRRRVKRGKPVPAPAPRCGAPYAFVLAHFAGLPSGPALARVLDECWSPSALPRRTKAWLFAVVARGLGCERSVAEASALLAHEGIAPAAVERTLSHLSAPELTAVEAVLVPFARETLWYTPAAIQRQARAVRDRVSREEVTEAIGVLALANAICRVTLALGRPA